MHKYYKNTLSLLLIPLISFFGSVWQALYAYDGFHWGLILFTADSINLKPVNLYKDVFIHYGPLTTLLESFVLKFFSSNIIYIFALISLFYAISIFIILVLINNIINYSYAILGSILIFSFHPFVISPWHNYIVFFFFNLYILLNFSNKLYLNYISPFLLSLAILFSESFLYPAILILTCDLTLSYYEKNKLKEKIFIILVKSLSFIIPLIIFFLCIFYKKLIDQWLIYHSLPNMYLREVLKTDIFHLVLEFFLKIFNNSYKKFFSEPQWFILVIIIISNLFYFIKNIIPFFLFKKNKIYLLISFSTLVFLYNGIHNLALFKFATGSILGIIIFLKIISSIKNIDNKLIIISFICLVSLSGLELSKNNSNQLYVDNYKINDFKNSDYFKYFYNQRWDDQTWLNLISLDKNLKQIKQQCNIQYAVNLTSDGFYSVIARDYFILDQMMPWYENTDGTYINMNLFYDSFFNYFDKDFYLRIFNNTMNKNLVIITDKQNFENILVQNKKINLSENMNYIDLPYSYYHKKKAILFPKNCIFNN